MLEGLILINLVRYKLNLSRFPASTDTEQKLEKFRKHSLNSQQTLQSILTLCHQ